MEIWISIIGFMFLFLYELNQVHLQNSKLKSLFFIGSTLIFGALFFPIQGTFIQFDKVMTWIGLVLLVPATYLLVYTLFFSFPFKESYITVFDKRPVYEQKMYALCRHPGVLWFILLFGSLVLIYPSKEMTVLALVQICLNLLYIILQDIWSFPKLFIGYDPYKQDTPFLIPSTKSILKAFQSYKRR